LVHWPSNIGFDGLCKVLLGCSLRIKFGQAGKNIVHEDLNARMVLDGIQFTAYRCFHRAASFMAQNQEKRRLKVAARILHAAHDLRRNDVSGYTNDEEL